MIFFYSALFLIIAFIVTVAIYLDLFCIFNHKEGVLCFFVRFVVVVVVGMKTKNGKKVPNCVPVKEQLNAPLPPIEKIADKFDKPVSTIKKVIKSGSKVEKEHTKDQKTAEKIATAHVNERPDYYKKLDKAGLEEGKLKDIAKKASIIGVSLCLCHIKQKLLCSPL